jgi:hypothetical protein
VGTVKSIETICDIEVDEAATAVIFDIDANLFKTAEGNKMRVRDYHTFYSEPIGRALAVKLSMESIPTAKLFGGLDYHKNEQE